MNPREKKILILTVIIALGSVAYLMISKRAESESAGGGGATELAEKQFDRHYGVLEIGPSIRSAYSALHTKLPSQLGDRSPEYTFSDEVHRLLTDAGWTRPDIETPKTSDIDDVEDYYYIDLEIKLAGEYAKVIETMAEIQEKGILVKEFRLDKPNMDRDQVVLEVIVARLAQYTEEDRSERRGSLRGRRRRS